jgi:excisionase family DNA binding protein
MIMRIQTKSDVLFKTEEAAKYMGLSPRSVTQYVQRGLLKPSMQIGRSYLFSKKECDRYQQNKRKPGAQPKKD